MPIRTAWPAIDALLQLEKMEGESTVDIVKALMARLEDEISGWRGEVWNEIISRTGGHNSVPELVPMYWVFSQNAMDGVQAELQQRMMVTVSSAKKAPDLWSDDRLINALAADWDVALARGRSKVTRGLNIVTSFDKSLYSFFLRPYGIMYIFYGTAQIILKDVILGGMIRGLQATAQAIPRGSPLLPYVRMALNRVDDVLYFTEKLAKTIAGVRPAIRKFFQVLLTAPLGIIPAVSPLASFVGIAGLSFAAGCLLGEVIFKGILPALGVELPRLDGSKEQVKSVVGDELYERMRIEASEVGSKINEIYREVQGIGWDFEEKGLEGIYVAPYKDAVSRLKELKKSVDTLSVSYGVEYVQLVKFGLTETIEELINKITVSKKSFGAAIEPQNAELAKHIDFTEVMEMLMPYIEEMGKRQSEALGRQLNEEEGEALVKQVIDEHREELVEYGEKLGEEVKLQQVSEPDKQVKAMQAAIEVVETIGKLADSDADVYLFEMELDTLEGIIPLLEGSRRDMVVQFADEIKALVQEKKEADVKKE